MRLDLCHYGLIGFQKEWRRIQGFSGNLLEELVKNLMVSGVDGCALVSEELKIPRDSVHDRFGIFRKIVHGKPTGLTNHRDSLSPEFSIGYDSQEYMVVRYGGKPFYIINSQAVRVKERDQTMKVLVVGRNDYPDGRTFGEIRQYEEDKGIIVPSLKILRKPFAHNVAGQDIERAFAVAESSVNHYDAFVGFDANASMRLNDLMQEFSYVMHKPSISVSGKHSLSSRNGSCIEILDALLQKEDNFLTSLRECIAKEDYTSVVQSESVLEKLRWKSQFLFGTLNNRHLNYGP